MSAATDSGPQLLGAEALILKSNGWYLPRGGSQWVSAAEYAPGPAVGERCWWSATEPPGDGWRWARGAR